MCLGGSCIPPPPPEEPRPGAGPANRGVLGPSPGQMTVPARQGNHETPGTPTSRARHGNDETHTLAPHRLGQDGPALGRVTQHLSPCITTLHHLLSSHRWVPRPSPSQRPPPRSHFLSDSLHLPSTLHHPETASFRGVGPNTLPRGLELPGLGLPHPETGAHSRVGWGGHELWPRCQGRTWQGDCSRQACEGSSLSWAQRPEVAGLMHNDAAGAGARQGLAGPHLMLPRTLGPPEGSRGAGEASRGAQSLRGQPGPPGHRGQPGAVCPSTTP